jgi:hypothetical protein
MDSMTSSLTDRSARVDICRSHARMAKPEGDSAQLLGCLQDPKRGGMLQLRGSNKDDSRIAECRCQQGSFDFRRNLGTAPIESRPLLSRFIATP